MATSKTVQAACDTLIKRVRFETASLQLQRSLSHAFDNDTAAIREATRIYTETWIVPMLRAIKANDLDTMRLLTH